jgi:ubiquinone/menaquinone biosynthesis C-methylase UbiE
VVDSPEVTRALSFGRGAASYDRVRPDYSPEVVDLPASRLGLGSDAHVLDLGAGTGKLTRLLVKRFARVTAVEPDQSMLAVLTQATQCYLALEGRADAIPLGDRSVDAVFVGQAFHWFDVDKALAEIGRVLRPRGGLVLVWNSWWRTEPPISQAATDLMQRVKERPSLELIPVEAREWEWHSCFAGSPFEDAHEENVETREVVLDAEQLVTLYLSTSPFGSLPPDELDAAESELRRLVVGEYTLPVETELYWTRLAE